MSTAVTPDVLEQLRKLGTCAVANAIEKFNVRLRNEGFTDNRIQCIFENRPAIIGFAAPGRIRSEDPPMTGGPGSSFMDRTDWWDYILSIPGPRIAAIEDIDAKPGHGSFWGEVHANIHLRLGCVGAITNGAVRYLDEIESTGFQLHAGSVAVSHAYVHFTDFGAPVQIAGLKIASGDLLLADRHGVLNVPKDIASEILAVAFEEERQKRRIIDFCRSAEFSIPELKKLVKQTFGHPDGPE